MTWPPPPAPAAPEPSVGVPGVSARVTDPRRHLPLDGTRNVRDVGGYPTAGGRVTRWRTLLRSDELTQLPRHAADELRALGVRQVIDLRWPDELERSPNVFAADPSIRYRHVPLLVDDPTPHLGLAGMYRHVLDERLPQLVEVARILLEPDGVPAIVGCAAGKDRTGITIAVLLSLAGVADDLVVEDYALSAGYFAIENPTIPADDWRHPPLVVDSPPEFMASALDHLRDAHGGVRALLRSGGLTEAELDALVDRLTEPTEVA
ncbi:MAG: tyrosine-protein phosphatase [Chloroflexota bacterium]